MSLNIKQFLPGFQRGLPLYSQLLEESAAALDTGISDSGGLVQPGFRDCVKKLTDYVNPNYLFHPGITEFNLPTSTEILMARHLAAQVGWKLIEPLWDMSSAEMVAWYRKQILFYVESLWFNGTYNSLKFIEFLTGFHLEIIDLYTEDYVNFVPVDSWFVGRKDNDPYSDSVNGQYLSYNTYKSPHFVVRVVLDHCVTRYGKTVLCDLTRLAALVRLVDLVRPVHTVPHYELYLEIPANFCGAIAGSCDEVSMANVALQNYLSPWAQTPEISAASTWVGGFNFELGYGRPGSFAMPSPVSVYSAVAGLPNNLLTAGETPNGLWVETLLPGLNLVDVREAAYYNNGLGQPTYNTVARAAGIYAEFASITTNPTFPLRIRWVVDRCCSGTSNPAYPTACCTPLDKPEVIFG